MAGCDAPLARRKRIGYGGGGAGHVVLQSLGLSLRSGPGRGAAADGNGEEGVIGRHS